MPKYWIVGWAHSITRQGKDPWGPLFCDWVDTQEKANPGVPFLDARKDNNGNNIEYFPIAVLEEGMHGLLSTLSNLSAILDNGAGNEVLQEVLTGIAAAAYEAGRNGITPPQSA